MTDDDCGLIILSRRARFIAAALAGAGIAAASCSGGGGDGPQVCLSPPNLGPDDAGQDAEADAPQSDSG